MTIADLEHDTEYKIRMRARYYRGEHEGKSWGGPWATETITVTGEPAETPTPEPAEEEPAEEEPVKQPPRDDPARDDPAPEDTTPPAGTIDTITATDAAGQLLLTWTAPAAPNADPTDYHVNWGKSAEDYPADTAEAGNAHPDSTTHTLVGLEYDTDYNIRVRARYTDGDHADSPWNGPWTETTAQVKLPLPAAPFIGATAVTPDGDVLLSWFNPDEDDSITGYQILRGPDAANLVVIEDDTGSSSTSYTDETPPAGQTHTYGVKARNASGLSDLSNTLTATVPEPEEELVTAQQSSEEILVSNHGGAPGSRGDISQNNRTAQAFVTGPGLAGFSYHFQGIRVSVGAQQVGGTVLTPQVEATIRNDNGGLPGTLLHTLTLPADFASTEDRTAYTLAAPSGTVLNRNTRYWVVIEVLREILLYDTTTSTDEDQRLDGWSIDNRRYARGSDDWVSLPRVIKLAVLGSPQWVTDEADGPDLPGAGHNAHKTGAVVTPGIVSTGHLTPGLDRNHGLYGDYWWLDTQWGHSYRIEVKFGNNPTTATGGSAWVDFIDGDRRGTCCDSDHNRNDGYTVLHIKHDQNQKYLIDVVVFDKLNEGSKNFNGPTRSR